jgi:hypothetical protein
MVNNLANNAVAEVVSNGLMMHPDVLEDSRSISSDMSAFFRAQGTPVTLELPLPADGYANTAVVILHLV